MTAIVRLGNRTILATQTPPMPVRGTSIALLSFLLPTLASAADGPSSLCGAEELVVISCRPGQKLAAIYAHRGDQ
jgi:hypothetical protein